MSTTKDVQSSCSRVPFSLRDKICRFRSEEYLLLRKARDFIPFTLIFTNGCFDMFHSGHASLLLEIKEKFLKKDNDFFIIGLNSDASISRNKGTNRPVVPEIDRAIVLASYPWVDKVIIFDEDSPLELLQDLWPDVLVKGRGYKKEEIITHDKDLVVILDEYNTGLSTTNLIEKL